MIIILTIFLLVSKNLISESSFFKRFSANIATKSVTENFIYLLFEQFYQNDKYVLNLDNDYRVLYKWRYKKDSVQNKITDDDIYSIIQDKPILAHNKIGAELKTQVQNSLSGEDPLYIWIILLESFKPQNGQWLYPKHKYSFTPYYDKLALSGISFSNAWTVGGVTRAGQQGSLCGSWTGESSDAFRGTFKYYPICIPEILNKTFNNSQSYYWYAGDLRFDDTQKFWTTHGVKFMTGLGDFAKDTESTWWGASDKSLFDKVNALVTNDTKIQLHIVMTLTNHPEFTVLHDLKYPDQNLLNKAEFNMQKTTYYTDLNLERFINNIKNKKLDKKLDKKSNKTIWDQSLLVMVNDHGNFIPDLEYPLSDKSKSPDKFANMLTRANLVLHGGLVENMLKKLNLHAFNSDISKSQADIYPTILDFLNINHIETISDSLFSEQRRWPVYTDGFGKIFVPPQHLNQYKVVQWKREDLLENKKVFIPNEDSDYYLTAKALFRLNEYLKIKGICCKKNSLEKK
ncbi:sulfatase-like hydrolase/transferase [Fluviispira vulneris]|uniref:sulfatase-like hydrolase/transferase n=1 Tax=Fluviispira vulneris TaxID=2763012 RepID=UPI0016485E4F|nr:sulfatase-like hydrolase/transferase [Fluviispira vulneris]